MKGALWGGGIVTLLYIVIAFYMSTILKETTLAYLWLYVLFGVPVIISYFILTVLYFKASRKVFYTTLVAICAIALAIVLADVMTGPTPLP